MAWKESDAVPRTVEPQLVLSSIMSWLVPGEATSASVPPVPLPKPKKACTFDVPTNSTHTESVSPCSTRAAASLR